MLELPASVKIGCRTYAIEAWEISDSVASQMIGECDKLNARIKVRADFNHEQVANTLLHEILHACFRQGHLADPPESEEDVVLVLTDMLQLVWQENPIVWGFIFNREAK